MIKLRVERRIFTDDVTIGELYIDDILFCYTLEDAVRPEKIYGKTAIPRGEYEVIINMSNRFKKLLPLLLNVPNYEGVRIHSGNTHLDTDGCIILGLGLQRDPSVNFDWRVTNSRDAMKKFMEMISDKGPIHLSIVNKSDDPGK